MDLQQETYQILRGLGSGQMSASVYDTAWLARLAEFDIPLGQRALAWIRDHQLPDGSWGTPDFCYHHERFICTLAAMVTLAQSADYQDTSRLQRAQLALETHARGLEADEANETLGFELIAPRLIAEAETLDLTVPKNPYLDHIFCQQATKLAALPKGRINREVTLAYSAEMVSSDFETLLDLSNLQEENGSVAYNPAATAWFFGQIKQDPNALRYLQKVAVDDNSAVPGTMIDNFEIAWSLWNLSLTDLLNDQTLKLLINTGLDFLEENWRVGLGTNHLSTVSFTDGDDTALVYDILCRFGRSVDLEGLLAYEEDTYFRCYPFEANQSLSTNVHVLSALRTASFKPHDPVVQKIRNFLQQTKTCGLFWHDKWHASPYYTTTHAIMAAAGYDNALIEHPVQWVMDTQNRDGSWGYYVPTAEETAYCLQALCIWQQSGEYVSADSLQRGAAWLAKHLDEPYTPLWISKSLYTPITVVRSAIISALRLVEMQTAEGDDQDNGKNNADTLKQAKPMMMADVGY